MSEPRPPPTPTPRPQTERDLLRAALQNGPATARELSASVGLPERRVVDHLGHLQRSLPHRGQSLRIDPARCSDCGFTFERRERLTKPSRCPDCRGERITAPRFWVDG